MADSLLFVTQVAPYRDGPAGVHGVLDQAAVGVAQVAELHGLRARSVDDVRDARRRTRFARLARSRSFTIGETPWSAEQRAAILERVRAGRLVGLLDPLRDRLVLRLGRVRRARRRALRRPSVDADVRRRRARPDASRVRAPRRRRGGGTTRCTSSATCGPTRRCCCACATASSTSTAPGARPPSFGYPLAWCFAEGDGRVFSTSLGHFPARVGDRPRTCATSRAASAGRSAPTCVTPARATSPTGRTGGCSSTRSSTPIRVRSTTSRELEPWRARVRARLDALLGPAPDAGAARPRDHRVGRLRRRTGATASCSTPRRRCRCPRTSSCRTTATRRPGRPCSRSTGTVRASRWSAVSTRRGTTRRRRTRTSSRRVGYVVLAPDLRGFGERADWMPDDKYHCDWDLVCATMAGVVPLERNLWDLAARARRARRAPARRSRRGIAAAGLSYGATCTLFLAAIDERVRAAVVSRATCRRGGRRTRVPWNMCGSQILPGQLGAIEHLDIAALIAPRPLLVETGTDDMIFPVDAARATVAALRRVVRAARRARRCARARRVRRRPHVARRRDTGVPGEVAVSTIDDRLAELGPRVARAVPAARSARRGGRARRPGAHVGAAAARSRRARSCIPGVLGADLTVEQGAEAARWCALNALVGAARRARCARSRRARAHACSGFVASRAGLRATARGRRRREPPARRRVRRRGPAQPLGDRRRRVAARRRGRDRGRGRARHLRRRRS